MYLSKLQHRIYSTTTLKIKDLTAIQCNLFNCNVYNFLHLFKCISLNKNKITNNFSNIIFNEQTRNKIKPIL